MKTAIAMYIAAGMSFSMVHQAQMGVGMIPRVPAWASVVLGAFWPATGIVSTLANLGILGEPIERKQ